MARISWVSPLQIGQRGDDVMELPADGLGEKIAVTGCLGGGWSEIHSQKTPGGIAGGLLPLEPFDSLGEITGGDVAVEFQKNCMRNGLLQPSHGRLGEPVACLGVKADAQV